MAKEISVVSRVDVVVKMVPTGNKKRRTEEAEKKETKKYRSARNKSKTKS